jgi:hypothetical protein
VLARLKRLEEHYQEHGMRRTCEGILVCHEHNHPHILMLQIANAFFKLCVLRSFGFTLRLTRSLDRATTSELKTTRSRASRLGSMSASRLLGHNSQGRVSTMNGRLRIRLRSGGDPTSRPSCTRSYQHTLRGQRSARSSTSYNYPRAVCTGNPLIILIVC